MFENNDGSGLIGGKLPGGSSPDGQAFKLDASGNLLVSTLGNTPATIQDVVRYYTMAGQAFSATTGKNTGPASGSVVGFELLNPLSSAKNLLIYSLILVFNSSNIHSLNTTSADANTLAGWADTACSVVNNKVGSAITSVAKSTYSNAAITGTVGNQREMTGSQNNQPIEILTNGECIWCPAGDATSLRGIALFLTCGAASIVWGVTANWIEF